MNNRSRKRTIFVQTVGYSLIGTSWVSMVVFGLLVLLLVVNWMLFAFFE